MLEGDPDAVLATARRFRQVSDDMDHIRGRFDNGGLSGSWEGPAADAFRQTVEDLPGELTKASHVNGQVADALFSFGTTLADLQARSRVADRELVDAQRRASLAQSDDTRAHGMLKTAQRAYTSSAHDPIAEPRARHTVEASAQAARKTTAALATARADVEARNRAIEDLRGERDDAAALCAKRIHAADPSFKDEVTNWYADKVHGTIVGTLLEAVADVVISPFTLAYALGEFIADPSWANAHKVLDKMGDLVMLIAVVSLFVFPPAALLLGLTNVLISEAKVYTSIRGIEDGTMTNEDLLGDEIGLGLAIIPLGKVGAKLGAKYFSKEGLAKGTVTRYVKYGQYQPPTWQEGLGEEGKGILKGVLGDEVSRQLTTWGLRPPGSPGPDAPTRYIPGPAECPVHRVPQAPPVLRTPGVTIVRSFDLQPGLAA